MILLAAFFADAQALAAKKKKKSHAPPPEQAEPAPTPKSTDEQAREYFEMAVEAFDRDSYSEALAFFQESYKLQPKKKVLYNIAMCQRALMDFKAAIETFKEYLEKGGKKLGKDKRKEVEKLIAEMESSLGKITVTVNEIGARILVDGAEVGISPIQAILAVNPGTHTVEAAKTGFKPALGTVEVKGGEHEAVSLTLVPEVAGPGEVLGVKLPDSEEKKKKKKKVKQAVLWSVLGVVLVGAGAAGGVLIWHYTSGPEAGSSADWTIHGR